MNRTLLVPALLVAAGLAAGAPAVAATPVSVLPLAVGQRVHYHLVRTVQGANGPLASVTDFDVVRRAGTTLVIERPQPDGTPNVSVLAVKKDGSLTLAEGPGGAVADPDVAGLLDGLNLALAATRGADPNARGAWAATLPVVPAAGTATAMVSVIPANVAAGGFDFIGDGQTTVTPPAPSDRGGASGGMRFPGGGGGFGGGGFGRSRGGGGERPPGGQSQQVSIHVEGHFSGARPDRVAVTQTRSIALENMPFVNVASWVLTVRP